MALDFSRNLVRIRYVEDNTDVWLTTALEMLLPSMLPHWMYYVRTVAFYFIFVPFSRGNGSTLSTNYERYYVT